MRLGGNARLCPWIGPKYGHNYRMQSIAYALADPLVTAFNRKSSPDAFTPAQRFVGVYIVEEKFLL